MYHIGIDMDLHQGIGIVISGKLVVLATDLYKKVASVSLKNKDYLEYRERPCSVAPWVVDLPVLGVDDVKLGELQLPLVPHGQGGVVPVVEHLRGRVGNYGDRVNEHHWSVPGLHDPNTRGQDCQSMGKLESIMGHLALIVNLE